MIDIFAMAFINYLYIILLEHIAFVSIQLSLIILKKKQKNAFLHQVLNNVLRAINYMRDFLLESSLFYRM